MAVEVIIVLIGLAGLVGGLINAFLAHEGFIIWKTENLPDGRRIWRPGFLGNTLVGVVTAIVLAGLYSPLGSVSLGGGQVGPSYDLTIGALVGALLSGIGGARLLTNEVDRRLLGVSKEELAKFIEEYIKKRPP